jgi:hypothetical protein
MVDSDDSDDDDTIMAFALASSAQLVFLIDWDSDSSDKEDLVDYWTLPHSTHHSFGHDRARYCISTRQGLAW